MLRIYGPVQAYLICTTVNAVISVRMIAALLDPDGKCEDKASEDDSE